MYDAPIIVVPHTHVQNHCALTGSFLLAYDSMHILNEDIYCLLFMLYRWMMMRKTKMATKSQPIGTERAFLVTSVQMVVSQHPFHHGKSQQV